MKNLLRLAPDLLGWKTNKKIVVIESDDWGGERMRDKETLNSIPENFKRFYNSPYYRFDSIARKEDLQNTFEVLRSIKGQDGRPAVITANVITGNPDFAKIEADNFERYHFIPFTKTLESYETGVFAVWEQGMEERVFHPQFHGRDHVNALRWLDCLRSGDEVYLDAFKRGLFSVDRELTLSKKNLMAALDVSAKEDVDFAKVSLSEGLALFRTAFSFSSESFIAPSYTWPAEVEGTLSSEGVKFLQGNRYQKVPGANGETGKKMHYLGQRNSHGQRYLVRNIFFEPSLFKRQDLVDDCLLRMQWAFAFKRPAIIAMHRLNLVGRLDPKNHESNLILLKEFLSRAVKKWPDIHFVTSDELGRIMNGHEG